MRKTILILALTAPVVLAGCSYEHYNTWNSKCNDMGGIVSETEQHLFYTRYECFVDGNQVTVPGYEGE